MNNIEKFVNALININKEDRLTIDKEEFFNNNEIKNIIGYYKFNDNCKDNLYMFAKYILKIRNKKLQKLNVLFNQIYDCDLIFNNLKESKKPKTEYICCLFIRYLLCDINYKKFEKYLLILQNLDVSRL